MTLLLGLPVGSHSVVTVNTLPSEAVLILEHGLVGGSLADGLLIVGKLSPTLVIGCDDDGCMVVAGLFIMEPHGNDTVVVSVFVADETAISVVNTVEVMHWPGVVAVGIVMVMGAVYSEDWQVS